MCRNAATRYRGGGQYRQREYITTLEDNVLTENGDIITQGFVPKMEPNHLDYCYLNQIDKGITDRLHSPAHGLCEHDKTSVVYEYVRKGYILGEIANELKLPKSTIAHHIEKIRKIGQSIGYIKNVQTGR